MVGTLDRQFHSEAQLSFTHANSDVPSDSPVFKHLSDPCTDITASVDNEPPTKKHKIFDAEKIIIGEELSDIEINYAQRDC